MAQQATRQAETGVETTETASTEGTTAAARKILDCCVGHPSETLRDAGGTIVSTMINPPSIFDVLVDVKFPETPRVVHSRSLGQYGIEELGFDGIETTENLRITTISAEYEGQLFGLRIVVNTEDGDGGDR